MAATAKVIKKSQSPSQDMTKAVNRFAKKAGVRILRRARVNVSGKVLKVRTGRLRRSLRSYWKRTGRLVEWGVFTNVFYGRIWEVTGRRAVTIRPRNKKVLRFTVGGKVVFSAYARQKAQRPRPFLLPAVVDEQRNTERLAVRELGEEYARLISRTIIVQDRGLGPTRVRGLRLGLV